MTTANIRWNNDTISWVVSGSGSTVSISVNGRVEQALALRGGGVAAIIRLSAQEQASAQLYNDDGSLRVVLDNPLGDSAGVEFYYFIYFGEDLHVVLAGGTGDFQSIVDEANGQLLPPTEAR